jgi:hypothetical protein
MFARIVSSAPKILFLAAGTILVVSLAYLISASLAESLARRAKARLRQFRELARPAIGG